MDNSKSTGYEVKRKNIALPYIAETHIFTTYAYKKNGFPTAFKTAKIIPLPKTKKLYPLI